MIIKLYRKFPVLLFFHPKCGLPLRQKKILCKLKLSIQQAIQGAQWERRTDTQTHTHTQSIVSARHCMKYSSSTLSKATTRTRGPVKRRFYCSLFLSLSPFWFYFHQRAWHSQSVRARTVFKPPTDNTRKSAHKSLTHTRTHVHVHAYRCRQQTTTDSGKQIEIQTERTQPKGGTISD